MTTFLATLAVFGVAVGAMALGVIIQGKRLRGSCGGVGDSCECSLAQARRCAKRQAA